MIMRIVHDKSLQLVELIPESRADHQSLDEQFGPWELTPDEMGLRGQANEDFELMVCRRETDGAVLIEIARVPEGDEGGCRSAATRAIGDPRSFIRDGPARLRVERRGRPRSRRASAKNGGWGHPRPPTRHHSGNCSKYAGASAPADSSSAGA